MIPTRRNLALWLTWALLCLLASFYTSVATVWWKVGVVWVLIQFLDAFRGAQRRDLALTRQMNSTLPVGVWSKVTLTLENLGHQSRHIQMTDHVPACFIKRGLPIEATLPPASETVFTYRIQPTERGTHHFARSYIRDRSPWGLWQQTMRRGNGEDVRVYPNFREIRLLDLLFASSQLGQLGIRKQRKRGEGMEFHQLREYIQGDALRQIDWKATSRMGKMISREYTDERDQRVFFLVDCGHTMRSRDGHLSHFDHALNAILLMAKVALHQGDSVGLSTFSGAERWLDPRKGVPQLNHILNAVFDVEPTLQTADYLNAARHVLAHLKKRALIVLITNLRDEDAVEIGHALKLLRGKHMILIASMRETVIRETLATPVYDFRSALRVAAAHNYHQDRQETMSRLRHQGVMALDVEPKLFPSAAVNAYLEIKRQGLL